MNNNTIRSVFVFLKTGTGKFAVGCLVGALVVFLYMNSENRRLRQRLESQDALLTQQYAHIQEIEGMSQAELESLVTAVHEQNRITSEVQNRLHEQEVALSSAPTNLIFIVLALLGILAWIIHKSHKEMNSVAVTTIRNAIGLTPPNMLKTFIMAQSQVNTIITAPPGSDESVKLDNKDQPQKRLQ